MTVERIDHAQRQAGPDRAAEIQRHPGDLVLPVLEVVAHDPACADIAKALDDSEQLATFGKVRPPAVQPRDLRPSPAAEPAHVRPAGAEPHHVRMEAPVAPTRGHRPSPERLNGAGHDEHDTNQ